jgi:hypothetical protein
MAGRRTVKSGPQDAIEPEELASSSGWRCPSGVDGAEACSLRDDHARIETLRHENAAELNAQRQQILELRNLRRVAVKAPWAHGDRPPGRRASKHRPGRAGAQICGLTPISARWRVPCREPCRARRGDLGADRPGPAGQARAAADSCRGVDWPAP